MILFLDIPSRFSNWKPFEFESSVSVALQQHTPGIQPFITHINMNGTNDCKGYIDKLEFIGTNYSPGKIVLNANIAGYANTNYYFDDVRGLTERGLFALKGVTSNGVPLAAVVYYPVTNTTHITQGTNVAGYFTWGYNGGQGNSYFTNVTFQGNSRWYIIATRESYNGRRETFQGNFLQWFSAIAYGGTNYSNTPVGAVSHVEEPQEAGLDDSQVYFGLWAAGKNFAICGWNSKRTSFFQVVGDPLVRK